MTLTNLPPENHDFSKRVVLSNTYLLNIIYLPGPYREPLEYQVELWDHRVFSIPFIHVHWSSEIKRVGDMGDLIISRWFVEKHGLIR